MYPEIAFVMGILLTQSPAITNNPQVVCMAENIYHEARAEPLEGLFSVAEVTNNRKFSNLFTPSTICGVVYQKKQFSWTRYKNLPIKERVLWKKAMAVSTISYYMPNITNVTKGALFFHSGKVSQYHQTLTYIATVGGHKFYTKETST